MGVKGNLRLIFDYFKLNLKKEWQYKSSFFMQIITMILNDVFFIIQWVIVYSLVDDICGYTLNDTLLLWSIGAGTFGFMSMFFEGVRDIRSFIYEGKLDVYLTQPKSVLLNIICSKIGIAGIGDVLYAFIVLFIIGAPWYWFLIMVPVLVVSSLLFTAVYVVFSSFSFYVKNGDASKISEKVIMGTDKYPFGIWKNGVKFILATVFPVLFYTIIPAEFLFMNFNIWWVLGYIGVTAIWVVLAFVLFNKGLKKYSSGSLMGGRL